LTQTEALARQRPLLLVCEDIHWFDPTSAEIAARIAEHIAGLPVLLLATHPPEFVPPWQGAAHTTSLLLTRLDETEAAALAAGVGGGARAAAARAAIVARADGVPLFVEELARAARDEGGADSPASLQAALVTRIEHSPAAKRVAQLGATIGRRFPFRLLATI